MPTERCWCGKELEAGMVMGEERIEAQRRCPTHGEDWRWRECGEAEPPDGPVRKCRLMQRIMQPSIIGPQVCAACPIPDAMRAKKLWDALRQRVLDLIKEAEEHQAAAVEDAAKEYWENRAAELLGFHDMMLKEVENADA